MANRLNEAIENNDYTELERLLREGVDPNDLNGSESPLKTVIQVDGQPEELELLLEYGADPNIGEGSGITIFTDIILLILGKMGSEGGNYMDLEATQFKPYLKLLLNYGASMNEANDGHPTARRAINDWATDYSWNARYFIANGMRVDPSDMDLEIRDIMESMVQEINQGEEHKTYTAKQRSALAKTGLSQNIMDSIMGNLDIDAFDMVGEQMLKDQYSRSGYKSKKRYDPKESYSDYRQSLYGDEYDYNEYDDYDEYNDDDEYDYDEKKKVRRKKKTKKKNKKKWGKAKKGGVGTPRKMDRIPYGARDSPEVGQEFIKAVIQGNYERIEEIISIGGDINAKNKSQINAIVAAIIGKKDPIMLEFILKRGANPNMLYNNFPLWHYVMNMDEIDTYTKKKIVELLIKYGLNINYERVQRGHPTIDRRRRPLDDSTVRYLREREYRNKELGEKKLNFSKLMNSRLNIESHQPDDMNQIDDIGNMIDEAEENKRDEELRNELISEYTTDLDRYGGFKKY